MSQLSSLVRTAGRLKGTKEGSALVGVVSLCTVMAIAGVGLLQIAGTAVRNETAALEERKAFWAAESGLHLLAGAMYNGLDAPEDNDDLPFGVITVNDIDVVLNVLHEDDDTTEVRASAFSGGPPYDVTTFMKAVRARIGEPENGGYPVRIIDWVEEDTFD
jgi:hypothetical protein